MGEIDIRKIEKEIDIFHKRHSAFNNSKATAILNLLRSFEDGCRLMGPIEMALTGSKEMMEMNNRLFLDAIDMAIKWAYSECKDDNSIDFTCDDRYLAFSFLLMFNAKPYVDICSAYISYSRGYFSAIVKDNKVSFSINKPVAKIIHADYSVEIKNKNNRYNLELIEIMSDFKNVKDEIISQIRIDDGHIIYTITPNIWAKTKKVLEFQFNSSRDLPGDWIIDGFTLNDYSNIWITLATWMMIHTTSCYFSGITGGALQDVVLTKSFDEIIQFIGNRADIDEPIIRKVIGLLVFDPNIRNNDVIYQPIIILTSELYALSPNLFLNSSPERNLISIVNKYQDKKEYSTFTNKRESLMAEAIGM